MVSRPVSALLVLALAWAGGACDPTADVVVPDTVVDDRTVALGELRDAVAAVAAAQDDADDGVNAALDAVRTLDRSVGAFLDPDRIDTAVEDWPQVRGDVAGVALVDLRDPYIEVALSADRARAVLSRAESRVDSEWADRYLAAEDDVLLAVRGYAEEADRVAQLLARHAPTYEAFVDQHDDFVERRFFFRSAEEASDAYATEVDPLLDDLSRAQSELAAQVEAWRAAGVAVNDATATARDVFADRPSDEPSVEPIG